MRASFRFLLSVIFIGIGISVWVLFNRPKSSPRIFQASLALTTRAPVAPSPILVDDFEVGQTQGLFADRKNRLDAFQGTWARRPSYTVITKAQESRPGGRGKTALRLEYSKLGGWCGYYTLLNGINVSRHNALTFWVKGEKGGERFDVGLADQRMQELEIDAAYAGPIMAFLPEGVTTEWQRVNVPLAGLSSDVDLARMGSMVLWFRYEGSGAIYLDDVAFVYDKEVERILEQNLPRAAADPRAPRASWVWKYDPVHQPKVRKELIDFCRRTSLRTLYLYLGEESVARIPPDSQKKLAEFLREIHAQGIDVHALQGNPLWALEPYHPLVLDWVEGFLEFNKGRSPEERVDGVHLDIEPYLTADWETGDRERLKAEFVELLSSLRKAIDSKRGESPFQMGLAIPTFYDREPNFVEKLLGEVDYAALMDYYDTGYDIIQNGRFHIDLANRFGKKLVVGVETQDLVRLGQGKRRNTFHEEGWDEMEKQLADVVAAFADEPSFGGLAIHAYDSYRLLQKGRNVPTRERPAEIHLLMVRKILDPVTVDGDLSDWTNASWLSVENRKQVVYGAGAWNGPQDLSFKAALQWEPEALLLALEVTDNALLQEKRGGQMWEGDHVEVWLDVDLEGDYNEAVNSADDFQIGLSPGNFGELAPEVHIWVPSVNPKSLKEVELSARKGPTGYTLEARLPTAFLFQTLGKRVSVEPYDQPPQIPRRISPQIEALHNGVLSSGVLKPGFRMGVMLDASDSDEVRSPQKCLISSSRERQWGDPTTFNIAELQ